MYEPLVTVIIPSYNHAQYIENAISSVLNQTYKNIELIIIDDGSLDESHIIIKKYMEYPSVTVQLNSDNNGQSYVLTQGLVMSRGSLVCFLASDDWYLTNKIELQVAKFSTLSSDYGCVYGTGARYFENESNQIEITLEKFRGNILKEMITKPFCVYPATPMFRRECFDKVKFDETHTVEGEGIFIKLAIYYKFDYVDEVVAVMRDHSYNTGKEVELMYKDNLRWWAEFFQLPDLPDHIKSLQNFHFSKLHRMKGLELIRIRRKFKEGRSALFKAIKIKPIFALDIKVFAGIFLTYIPSAISNKLLDFFSV